MWRESSRQSGQTSMISKGLPCCPLKALTAKLPFSVISTVWPYFSRILTESFWLTILPSASRMPNVHNLTPKWGLTVLDSSIEIKADVRCWALIGDIACELPSTIGMVVGQKEGNSEFVKDACDLISGARGTTGISRRYLYLRIDSRHLEY